MGISYKKFYLSFIWKLLPFFFTILFVGAISLIINFFGKKKFFQEISRAEKSKINYLKKQKGIINTQLSIIEESSHLLDNMVKNSSQTNFAHDPQLRLIRLINKSAQYGSTMIHGEISKEEVDVEAILKECVLIQSTYAYVRKIEIKCHFGENISKINLDLLKFEQVILSILSLIIDVGPEKTSVQIEISDIFHNSKKSMQILIQDDGQAFDQESWKKLGQYTNENNPYLTLNYEDIDKIITLHRGSFFLESKHTKGKKFKILLPYVEIGEESEKQMANVVDFPRR